MKTVTVDWAVPLQRVRM